MSFQCRKYTSTFFMLFLISILTVWAVANGLTDSPSHASLTQQIKTEPLTLPQLFGPPVIDGDLRDSVWRSALILKDFVQTFPGDNISPTFPTEVLLGYNEGVLYIGIHSTDEPGRVRTTLAKRDDILNDDHIRIYLDTFNDRRRAYLLIFNPLGIQQDGIFVEGTEQDYSVDIVMESRGALTADGYCVEVAIPFRSIRHDAGEGQQWGIHIIRKIKHLNDEEDSWMPLIRGNIGLLNQAGRITGMSNIEGKGNLEIIPTLTLSERGRRTQQAGMESFVSDPFQGNLGLSAKLSSASNLAFDLALNPDFAQVEADQFVVTANQRFPIFFEEKRPFFLEGIDIFQTPLTTVHTRTIINPNAAFKVSGKFGGYTLGLLAASDNAPGKFSDEELANQNTRPNIERFIGKNAYLCVARLKRDIGTESYVGFLATSYSFVDNENRTIGIDSRFNFTSKTALSLQIVGTASRRYFYEPDINKNVYRNGSGFGYHTKFLQSGRHLIFTVEAEGRTPDYRADVGFTTQTNTNKWYFVIRYNSEPKPDATLISWSAVYTLLVDFDWQGRMKYSYHYPRILLSFPNQSFINLYAYSDYLRLLEEEFGPRRTETQPGAFAGEPERSTVYRGFTIEAGTTPIKEFTVYVNVDRAWHNFDFDFGSGSRYPRVSPAALKDPNAPLDPGIGNTTDIKASLTYQSMEALRLSFDFIKSRLFREDTKRVAFDQNIFLLGTTYQFSRFSFARLRVEYESLVANVRAQLLLGWTPSPGTALYVGYNEDLNYNGYNPFTQIYERGLHRNSRTFFLKISYVFQHGI